VEKFTTDLQMMLGQENADVSRAISNALATNFNLNCSPLDHVPDPSPVFMFDHCEDTEPADMIAHTFTKREAQLNALKKYISELGNFDINDL
jgi:hypothetical protein